MIQAALGSQSTRLGTHGCREEAFRADDSSARPCGGTVGLQLCCAQSAAAVAAAAGQKERERSERRGAPLRDESRLEIGHEADSDAATEGHSGPEVEQKS